MKKSIIIQLFLIFSSSVLYAQQSPKPFFGLLKPTQKQLSRLPRAAASAADPNLKLLDSVDLSAGMPVSGDQGCQGSCAAFAAVYDCLTYLENHKSNTRPAPGGVNDSSKVFSPKYLFNKLKMRDPQTGECRTGVLLKDILIALMTQGSPTIRDLPYIGSDPENCLLPFRDQGLDELAKKHVIATYVTGNYSMIQDLQNDLSAFLPGMFGIEVDTDFNVQGKLAARNHLRFIYHVDPTKGPMEYHALTVIGYNNLTGLVKILNSWGPDWGSRGYFYMTYYDFIHSAFETYTAIPGTSTAIAAAALVTKMTTKIKLGVGGRYQGYFRLGFYKKFDQYSIGINFINKNKGEVILSVLDPVNKSLVATMLLQEDQAKYFSYKDQKITITFSGIDIDGISSVKNDVLLIVKVTKDDIVPVNQKVLKM